MDSILIGKGNYAQGLYDRGDICNGLPGTVITRSARLTWLDGSRCTAKNNFVSKDKLCTYSVNVCPCNATRSLVTVFAGELATILIAIIITLACFIVARYTISSCSRTREVFEDIELQSSVFDWYETVIEGSEDQFFGGNVYDAFANDEVEAIELDVQPAGEVFLDSLQAPQTEHTEEINEIGWSEDQFFGGNVHDAFVNAEVEAIEPDFAPGGEILDDTVQTLQIEHVEETRHNETTNTLAEGMHLEAEHLHVDNTLEEEDITISREALQIIRQELAAAYAQIQDVPI